MKQFDSIWIVWLLLVFIWNFGWPEVHPVTDVLVAVILSITAYQIKNRINKNIIK